MQRQRERPDSEANFDPSYQSIKKLWTITFAFLICVGCFTGIVDNIVLYKFGLLFKYGIGISFTTYGLMVSLHSIVQYIRAFFSYLNVKRQRSKARKAERHGEFSFPYIVCSYGHKERLDYYERHLRSIRDLDDADGKGAWFMIDGNGSGNDEMLNVFDEIFGNEGFSLDITSIDPSYTVPYEQMDDYHRQYIIDLLVAVKTNNPHIKYFCLSQPHGGKREIMYLAMEVSRFVYPEIVALGATDSDTVMEKHTYRELKYMFFRNEKVAGVTGDVGILNVGKNAGGNLLSRLSAIRYWNAFNVERASQSLSKSVMCMSGPNYMVRIDALQQELEGVRNIDRWKQNRFLGMLDNYGDDRGLTNILLNDGWEIMYTHFSKCITETPTSLVRFYKQQRRWMQSANREASRTIRSIFESRIGHPAWMTYDLIYQTFFPILLMIGIFFQLTLVITEHSFVPLVSLLLTVFLTGLIRGIVSAVISRDAWKILNCLYGFVFIFVLVPARVDAIIHLWDTGWGTASRANMKEGGEFFNVITWPYRFIKIVFLKVTGIGKKLDQVNSTEDEDSSLMQ